ncbi:MAG: hypothetical protein U0796_04060 [Gemmatales bacterium]
MKKFLYCVLAAFLVQIILTVLSFQHLTWWQALLASFLLFVTQFRVLAWIAKFLFVGFLRRAEEEVKQLANPQLLDNAQIILHAIEPSPLPRQLAYALENPILTEQQRAEQAADYAGLGWHAIDVTVVPHSPTDQAASRSWQPFALSLIPIDSTPSQRSLVQMVSGREGETRQEDCAEGYDLHELRLQYGKEFLPLHELPDGYACEGPQRLQFIVGVPKEQAVLKFAYHGVTFGRLELYVPASRSLLAE